jgi:hypothetical protein
MKPNRENIVIEMLVEIERGITYKDCLALNDFVWQLPERTFCRYWKTASETHAERQQAIKTELDKVLVDSAKERLKKAILTKDERMEILTKIAKGEIIIEKEVITKMGIFTIDERPDFNDRKNAIAELNKMDGSYAPLKTDMTSGGEALNAPIFNIVLADEDTEESV